MTRYFDHLNKLQEIKSEYRRLTKIHHPDVGGDTATMQAINSQYAEAVNRIARDGEGQDRANAAQEVPAEFIQIISKVISLQGINLDLVGAWLWITGNTYAHKDALKAAGFKWAAKKRAWYWYPEYAAVTRGGRKSLDEIKEKYGSASLTGAYRAPRTLTA